MDLKLAAEIEAGRYVRPAHLQAAVEKLHKELKQDQKRFAAGAPK
jgi:hypothetical protein